MNSLPTHLKYFILEEWYIPNDMDNRHILELKMRIYNG